MSVASSIIKLTNKQKEAPMDQSETSVTIVNATEDFLKSQIAQKDERIANLESHISTVTQRSYTESAERNRMRNEMQEWTLEAIENGTFDESTAQEIADICGFELTKEFEVEVTVMYSVTVLARDEESATNAIQDIDFDTVDYNSENISWLSSSIDRVDI